MTFFVWSDLENEILMVKYGEHSIPIRYYMYVYIVVQMM